jgi:hypothetical protein
MCASDTARTESTAAALAQLGLDLRTLELGTFRTASEFCPVNAVRFPGTEATEVWSQANLAALAGALGIPSPDYANATREQAVSGEMVFEGPGTCEGTTTIQYLYPSGDVAWIFNTDKPDGAAALIAALR